MVVFLLKITKEEEAKANWKGWIIYIKKHPKHTCRKEYIHQSQKLNLTVPTFF